MAITIDQFLRDLTESQVLSGEELSAFRRELAALNPQTAHRSAEKNGSPAGSLTKTATETNAAPLVLCDCLINEKVQDDPDHWVFAASRLRDDSPVTIHLLIPEGTAEGNRTHSGRNGTAKRPEAAPAEPVGIANVGRHGEVVCLCCESIEAETLLDLVNQHESLPLELATETLLEIVQTIKEMQERGLELQIARADRLLLDEDGRIHLSAHDPEGLRGATGARIPSKRLLASLGELYEFLQTGGEAEFGQDSNASDPLQRSARLVSNRLLMRDASPGYERWEELLRDLENLRDGREVSEFAETKSQPKPPDFSTASGRWVLVALTVLCGLVLAAWAIFNK